MVNAVMNETPECLGQFAQVLTAWKGVCINEVSSDSPARLLEEVVSECAFCARLHLASTDCYRLNSALVYCVC